MPRIIQFDGFQLKRELDYKNWLVHDFFYPRMMRAGEMYRISDENLYDSRIFKDEIERMRSKVRYAVYDHIKDVVDKNFEVRTVFDKEIIKRQMDNPEYRPKEHNQIWFEFDWVLLGKEDINELIGMMYYESRKNIIDPIFLEKEALNKLRYEVSKPRNATNPKWRG